MARRRGKPGSYLMTDDNSGFTEYAYKLKEDYWGNQTSYGLKRNLQEISGPIGDPYPVAIFRGSQYEATSACDFETTPLFIGKTRIPFPQNSAYTQFQDLDPGIGSAAIGCTFVVGGDQYLLDDNGFLVDEYGGRIIIQ